jgi:anti-sigma B factor antagonist
MFVIDFDEAGHVVMTGRLDAAQASTAQEFLDHVAGECMVDMSELEYISSAGLGVLLKTHKRLMTGPAGSGSNGLKLVNVNNHIYDIFRYSGFDKLFNINKL